MHAMKQVGLDHRSKVQTLTCLPRMFRTTITVVFLHASELSRLGTTGGAQTMVASRRLYGAC